MKKKTFIYALLDPTSNEIRYIGKANEPRKRLYDHVKECRNTSSRSHKNSWIRSLLLNNQYPLIEIIDEVCSTEWEFWEKYWISQFKCWGMNLTNLSPGGYDNNYKRDDITKQKMRGSKLGSNLSTKHKSNISKSVKQKFIEDPNYNHCQDKIHTINKELLYQKYITENLSLNKCAKFFETSKHTIFRNITECGFKKSKEEWISQVASHPKKVVIQYSLSGDFIREWDSIINVENELGFNKSNIANCCRGIIGSSRGYIWKYKNNI